jgi:hypothetical protein
MEIKDEIKDIRLKLRMIDGSQFGRRLSHDVFEGVERQRL